LYKIGEPEESVKFAVDPVFALCVSAVYQKEEIDRLEAENKGLEESMTLQSNEINKLCAELKAKDMEVKRLKDIITSIKTCLSILKNTKTEDGLKELPSLANTLQEYIDEALKGVTDGERM